MYVKLFWKKNNLQLILHLSGNLRFKPGPFQTQAASLTSEPPQPRYNTSNKKKHCWMCM